MRIPAGILVGIGLLSSEGWGLPLECSQEMPNFGAVAKGQESSLRLVCRNTSRVPLQLEPPGSSCPCLQATISKERLAPGEALEVKLYLSTAGLSGKSQFYVAIPLHGPMEGAKILPTVVDVRPQVIAIPEFVDLGNVRQNGARQVLVLDTTGSPLELRHTRVRNGSVQVRIQSSQFLQRGGRWQPVPSRGAIQGYVLEIQPRQGSTQAVSDEIELVFENSPQRTLRLRITGYSP
ncbi:MAG: hypothetical protein RL318_1304 [Fibrobacterota bacterium]|jgi:hypothetical protein